MDNKFRRRRQAIKRERGRRRASWVLVIVVIFAALGLFLWLRSSEVFAVKHITLNTIAHVSEQAVYEATLEARGESLLKLGTEDIKKRLLENPYVRSVEVYRSFPNTLEITLEEYEAVACVEIGGNAHWLVSQDGRVLEKKHNPSLPLIASALQLKLEPGDTIPANVSEALSVAETFAELNDLGLLPQLSSIMSQTFKIIIASGGEITISAGIELRIGEPTNLEQKFRVAETIAQQYSRENREIEYINVRVPSRGAAKSK